MAIIMPLWLIVSFYAAQILMAAIIWLLHKLGVNFLLVNNTILNTVLSSVLYILTLSLVIFVPKLIKIKNHAISNEKLGLKELPTWSDILLGPAGFVIYIVVLYFFMIFVTSIFKWIDISQVQETGFSSLGRNYEYLLAFLTLVVIAPIAEETLFRGYLFQKMKRFVPIWLAVIITSVVFGFLHGQWNVAIDTFILSVVACILRQATGRLWAPILLHMLKNGLAFYFLFINPLILTTLK
jgi:membrane protease YdiL (CAAX protease family)